MKPFARAGRADSKAGARRRPGIGKTFCVGAAAALVAAIAAVPASAEVESGRNLELNHSIELGVLEGWNVGDTVLAEIYRGATINPATHEITGGVLIASHEATFTAANENQQGSTTYDINHVGPDAAAEFGKSDCWDVDGDGVSNGTDGIPDVIPGDLFVATVLDAPGGDRTADVDYTFIRNISFSENPDGSISGHARGVETGGAFDTNAAIVPGDPEAGGGTALEAKRVGAPEEADYTFVAGDIAADGTFADVAVGGTPGAGELFIDALDSSGGGTGNTVTFVEGTPGEATGCGDFLSTGLTSNTHPSINIANQNSPMTVGGPETGPATVASVTFGGTEYTAVNHTAGAWSLTIPAADIAALPEGPHSLLVTLSDASTLNRTIVKDVSAPLLSASPGSGTYTGNIGVALSSNGGELVRFTQDGSVPSNTSRAYDGTPIALGPGTHTIRAFSVDSAGNRSDATFSYTVNAPAGAGGAGGAGGTGGAGAGGAAGGGAAGDVLGRITGLRTVSLRLSRARRFGITVSFNVPEGARFVRVSLFRQANTSRHNTRRLVTRRTFAVSRSGRHTFRIRDRRTRRKLQRGTYTIQVAPGLSESSFQEGTARRFRIR